MSECPYGKRFKPLPLRRGFWRELPKKIKEGVIFIAEDMPEREDVRNAAQLILISHIESRLMQSFKRPVLLQGGEFYTEFFRMYMKAMRDEQLRIFEEIACEVTEALAENPGRDLTDKEAAYLTYTMLGHHEPPSSEDFYRTLPVYARVYEELIRKKYAERYEPAIFREALRKHMPTFILRLISMESTISIMLTQNMKRRDLVDEWGLLEPETILDPRLMGLGEDGSFFFLPRFIDEVYKHAQQHGIKTDPHGRTEDRGCPVLYAPERDAIIRFGIEELIAQHELFMHTT